ncbi:helix-turn-helix domain-containing protein [Plantibacter sp. VKM Ac-2885]|uniref:helix-turn-helix domain-containing protein n=1 Tax=Plantibacter sp. VKM Ac-2885 TaxID=2783828 RepID=UPI00188AEB48|nr:helix-turn-helix transcriptional regulator [Plantibacter sp. VKM Ac-2885]MBF4512025.1 helix-turn-helix domain-containing protein [Plantibacter sp. VKM Ac-2885]
MTTARSANKSAIGQRIASYRKLRGFKTAEALAEFIPDNAVSRSTIVNIEAGRKSDPSIRDVLAIAYGLRVSPLSLIFDVENLFEPAGTDLLVGAWAHEPAIVTLFEFIFENPPELDESTMFDPIYRVNMARDLVKYQLRATALERQIAEIHREAADGAAERQIESWTRQLEATKELIAVLLRTAPLANVKVPAGAVEEVASLVDSIQRGD